MRLGNFKTRLGRVAVGSLAALCVSLLLVAAPSSVAVAGDKTRDRAARALREGEYALAEQLFREILAKNHRDQAARLGLSYALLKMRRLASAFEQAAAVVAVDPLSARAHALAGSALLAGGDFPHAVEAYRTALSLKEDESLAIAGLAMIDYYENRLNASLAGLRRAVFISPRESDYIFSLAQAASRAERYKEAADAYERFLQVAPRTDEDRRARIRGLIDFLRYLGGLNSLYDISGAQATTVAFDMPNNRPILKVRVNGRREPLRFVLDTGSGMSVISDETARLLGVSPVARGGMARAVGGKFEIVYGFLRSVEIGDAKVENVPVYIRRFYNDEIQVDGYIGLAVVNRYLMTVDYGARTFSLARPGSNSAAIAADAARRPAQLAGIEIPFRSTSSGFLSGEVQVEGVSQPFNFIIDTGASISVVSEKMMELDEMHVFKRPRRMKIYGAAGVAEGVQTLVLPRVVFGAQAREKLDVAVLDLEPVNETTGFVQSGIIGGNFLRHFRVTFDFRKSVILLEPLEASASSAEGGAEAAAAKS
ncbi:MAG TPA: aspartyl protease family protein [Pyrinomonadaceae bacterium]|nr:aspartyl protease family protein [Pyrinomonadaceae bacterium]